MHGDGEAEDGFTVDGDYAAAVAALFVEREFEGRRNAEGVQLAAGGIEKGFRVGEFLDGDTARVKRGGWLQRARGGDTQADGVAIDSPGGVRRVGGREG